MRIQDINMKEEVCMSCKKKMETSPTVCMYRVIFVSMSDMLPESTDTHVISVLISVSANECRESAP